MRTAVRFALVALLAASASARSENWPQWRGSNYDGVSKETGLPAAWGEGKNVVWKAPLPGMGGATPCIWGDRIFVLSEDGQDIVLLCIDTDGKERWKRPLGKGGGKARGDEGNASSPSPSTDGKHVWAFAGSGELVCFDFDGNETWRVNTQEKYGKFRYDFGMHTTPLLHGDRIYLPLIHSKPAWVVALDKTTGKEVWKVERPSDGHSECEKSYASPCVWQNGKNAYLVVHGNDYATAHAFEDGREIWRLGGLNPKDKYNPTFRLVASPVAVADLIVIPSCKNGPVVGVKPDATGAFANGSPHEQWRRPANTPDVPSPLVHEGLVYLCRENGVLICMDAKTGKEHYQQRTYEQRYRASPVYADGKIYLTARDGTVTVVKAGPKFEVLARNKLPDLITASPAIANGRIYLRGFNALYAIADGGK